MSVLPIHVGPYTVGAGHPLLLIAGPCVIESEDHCLRLALDLKRIAEEVGIHLVFKASFDKANRTSGKAYRGLGIHEGLRILELVAEETGLPVTTDVHEASQAAAVAEVCEILQIPAFLARQTDLLIAAAQTGKVVNIKKGQFLSGEAMKWAVDKVCQAGNPHVILTERGNSFGYSDLVVDFRNLPAMREFEVPVVMDVTHSLQRPNQSSGVTGGQPALIETIAKAAIAVGADGLFIETHPTPATALSDGANMLPLDQLEALLMKLTRVRQAIQDRGEVELNQLP